MKSVPPSNKQIHVSVVVPFYNEENNIPALHGKLLEVLNRLNISFEFIYVDDGSIDNTWKILCELSVKNEMVHVMKLRGNFGQTAALAAGFDRAEGDIIVAMDGDLQHDPEDLPNLLAPIREGYDIASGWRKDRIDPWFSRKLPSKMANFFMAKLSGIPLHDFGTTYKAYRRVILENIRLYGQFHRFIPVLAAELKPKIKEVPIRSLKRKHGKTKYGIKRTFTVFFDLIRLKFFLKYLSQPLQIFGTVGATFGLTGFSILLFLSLKKIFQGISIMEYRAPLFFLSILLVITGIQIFSIGLLGEILIKVYHDLSSKPIYSVAEERYSELKRKIRQSGAGIESKDE